MKYGESTFDIIYLVFAIVMGICILRRKKDAPENGLLYAHDPGFLEIH